MAAVDDTVKVTSEVPATKIAGKVKKVVAKKAISAPAHPPYIELIIMRGGRSRGSSIWKNETQNKDDDVPTQPLRRGKKKEKVDAKKDSEPRIVISGDPKEGS